VTPRSLNESPTHVLDELFSSIQSGQFTRERALWMLALTYFVSDISKSTDLVVRNIALSDATASIKACSSILKRIDRRVISKFISEFTIENKIRIENDLRSLQRRLLQSYEEAKVEIYRDN